MPGQRRGGRSAARSPNDQFRNWGVHVSRYFCGATKRCMHVLVSPSLRNTTTLITIVAAGVRARRFPTCRAECCSFQRLWPGTPPWWHPAAAGEHLWWQQWLAAAAGTTAAAAAAAAATELPHGSSRPGPLALMMSPGAAAAKARGGLQTAVRPGSKRRCSSNNGSGALRRRHPGSRGAAAAAQPPVAAVSLAATAAAAATAAMGLQRWRLPERR